MSIGGPILFRYARVTTSRVRPTQSILYVPYRFQIFILLIVQYNIQNPVPEILFSRI